MAEITSSEKLKVGQSGSLPQVTQRSGKVYKTGTLQYTLTGLIILSFWLIWGDFCLVMLESVVPKILPLTLESSGASKGMIGIIVGSIPAVINMMVVPWISMQSDQHRGSLGRRIPFLLWASPLAALLLMSVGYSHVASAWLGQALSVLGAQVSPITLSLIVVCGLIVSFHFFNGIMVAMYNCLLADVVPREVIGRFMSILRTVSLVAKVVFSRYIFGLYESHQSAVFLGIGLLYMVSFLIMCWRVKEGEYTPLTQSEQTAGRFHTFWVYLRESFTTPYYICIFMVATLVGLSGCMVPFFVFFQRDTLGLTLDNIGKFHGWLYLAQALICIPIGYVCDRIHPVRTCFAGIFWMAGANLICFFFIRDWNSLLICSIIAIPGAVLFQIGSATTFIILFPRHKFGQFSSAVNLFAAVNLIIGNYLAGTLIDWTGNYSLPYLWTGVVCALAVFPMIYVYRKWKLYGGANNYVPPEVRI